MGNSANCQNCGKWTHCRIVATGESITFGKWVCHECYQAARALEALADEDPWELARREAMNRFHETARFLFGTQWEKK